MEYRKKSIKKEEKAFSLVELLISLIIISLLVTAFIPLITKKLKASDITVGSFGGNSNNGSGYSTRGPRGQADCDKFNALFIPAALNGGKNVCVTKYNVGDNFGPDVASSATLLNVGETCTDLGNCCWQGKTARESDCSVGKNRDSMYDGCNRTVCQWRISNISCAQWAPKGSVRGSRRLPTNDELMTWGSKANFATVNVNQGTSGLQICSDVYNNYGMDVCHIEDTKGCKGGCSDTRCCPYCLWALNGSSDKYYIGAVRGTGYIESSNATSFLTDPLRANSARCVLEDGIIDETQNNNLVADFNDTTANEPKSQEDCDKIANNTLFISKKMNDGFHNVCVTKYNVGDSGGPSIANGVGMYANTASCSKEQHLKEMCCWKGTTTLSCTNNGYYDGCTRTLCQRKASDLSCSLWDGGNGKTKGYWRLPKTQEMAGRSSNIATLLASGTNNGLMLCDHGDGVGGTVYGVSRCSYTLASLIYDGTKTYAIPYGIWTKEGNSTYQLGKNNTPYFTFFVNGGANPVSARCVYDGNKYAIDELENDVETIKSYDLGEPTQAFCEGMGTMFIPKNAAGNSYGRNMCATRYNVGDTNYGGPAIPSRYVVVSTFTKCSSGNCCRQGTTTDNCINTANGASIAYNACNRTTCQFEPANAACKEYAPNGMKKGYRRLPNTNEFDGWGKNIASLSLNQGHNGLILCDGYTPNGSQRCHGGTYCPGSPDNYCRPEHLWTETTANEKDESYYNYFLGNGAFVYVGVLGKNYSLSARCVMDGYRYWDDDGDRIIK